MTAYEEPHYYRPVYISRHGSEPPVVVMEGYQPKHRARLTRTGGSTANTISPSHLYYADAREHCYERLWTHLDDYTPRHRV